VVLIRAYEFSAILLMGMVTGDSAFFLVLLSIPFSVVRCMTII
jgi:hypothetical protein